MNDKMEVSAARYQYDTDQLCKLIRISECALNLDSAVTWHRLNECTTNEDAVKAAQEALREAQAAWFRSSYEQFVAEKLTQVAA